MHKVPSSIPGGGKDISFTVIFWLLKSLETQGAVYIYTYGWHKLPQRRSGENQDFFFISYEWQYNPVVVRIITTYYNYHNTKISEKLALLSAICMLCIGHVRCTFQNCHTRAR